MENKRKAVADNKDGPGQRQRRSREEEALEDTATSRRTETRLGTLRELEQELQPAVGLQSSVFSQLGGALDRSGVSGTGHGGFSQATPDAAGDGITEISPAMAWLLEVTSGVAVGSSQIGGDLDHGGVSGAGHAGFSQSTPMVQPPVGNPGAAGDAQIGNARDGPPQQAQGQPGQQASSEPDNPSPPPPSAGQI